jgi:Fic family protein
MRVDLYREFASPLSDELLFRWHQMLMNGRRDLKDVGRYRTEGDPMQIVSGPIHDPRVHFEAPPAADMPKEMARFIKWFNGTAPDGKRPLPALTRAGIAHWHFVAIHPFEDGNGRIARALAEKALSQNLQQPALITLSHGINAKRKTYYDALAKDSRDNEITDWLLYFAETVLSAQKHAQELVDFLIAKTRYFDRMRGQLNERQEKVLLRMFREGPGGFEGGLSAEKYLRISGTSRATTTRDLQDLVDKGALMRTGERKGTRYHLSTE